MKRRIRVAAAICAVVMMGCRVAAQQIVDVESGESWAQLTGSDQSDWDNMTNGAVSVAAGVPEIKGKSAALIDLAGGEVLFEKDADVRLPIASVTKVMTLLLTMEAIDQKLLGYDDMLTCSAEASSLGGSQIWLEPGENMSVNDLLKAVAVVSANDACAVLAETIAGSIEGFVEQMNARAAELGMQNTMFLDCCGLNDEAYSSARDVAIMSRELMKHADVTKYTTIWMDSLRGGKSELVNTNKMIRFYEGATGLKTGTTSTAGHCLSATAERNGVRLCAVILGCASTADRFGGARKMLDYGFANYAVFTPQIDEAALTPVKVLHGVKAEFCPEADAMDSILVKRGSESEIRQEIALSNDVEAPVLKGQVVGEIRLVQNGETVAAYALRAPEDIARLDFQAAFLWLWKALCG